MADAEEEMPDAGNNQAASDSGTPAKAAAPKKPVVHSYSVAM